MQEYYSDEEIALLCKALSSGVRLGIVRHIAENKNVKLHDLAQKFHVSNAAITQNVKILQAANIVELKLLPGHGSTKVCLLKQDKFLINLTRSEKIDNVYELEVPIGQYVRYEAHPTCGIATTKALIGEVDDPRYFAYPERTSAGIMWVGQGYFEYLLPNLLKEHQTPTEIQLTMELASEAPGVAEKWPSDIHFSLNGTALGFWTSPGDFGDKPGAYTPDWWISGWNQYGLLKLLTINEQGTFVDGNKISSVTLPDLQLDSQSEMRFCVAAPADAHNKGGLTVFGKGFGNYNQDIRLRVFYEEREK